MPCSRVWFIFEFLASSDRPAVKVKWYDGGPAAVSNFPDYAGPLTETILLGNLAVWAADTADVVGKKIEWDAKKLVATARPKWSRSFDRRLGRAGRCDSGNVVRGVGSDLINIA